MKPITTQDLEATIFLKLQIHPEDGEVIGISDVEIALYEKREDGSIKTEHFIQLDRMRVIAGYANSIGHYLLENHYEIIGKIAEQDREFYRKQLIEELEESEWTR